MEDPALQNRRASRQQHEIHDDAYGRFILRRAQDLTREDRAYLRSGNNDLIQLVILHAGMSENTSLEAIFEGD
jgi:hypothetical protein